MKVIVETLTRSVKTELTNYVKNEIIDQYRFEYDKTDELEAIANRQAEVTARLIETLVEKEIISLDDAYYITNGYKVSVAEYLIHEK